MGASLPSGGGRGRRGRAALNAEINVTPFVDVVLVLLIVFMITAPLLVRGEDVNLPQTASAPLPASDDVPLVLDINAEGQVFIQQTPIPTEELVAKLVAITGEGYEEQIHIRGDQAANYGDVLQVLAALKAAGFRETSLVTRLPDTPAER